MNRHKFDTLFDNLYNVLFNTNEGLEIIKEEKPLHEAALIVVLVSVLDNLVSMNVFQTSNVFLTSLSLVFTAIMGLLSWLFFAAFFEITSYVFGQSGKMKTFLTLSGFALVPWLFLATIELLKNSNNSVFQFIGIVLGLFIWLRSVILIIKSLRTTYDLTLTKTVVLMLLPIFGGIILFSWLFGFFYTLMKILF